MRVLILDGAECDELAVGAARRHHRNLALEIDERFEHAFLLFPARPGLGRTFAGDSILTCPLPS